MNDLFGKLPGWSYLKISDGEAQFLSHKLCVFSKSTNVGNSLKMTRVAATLGSV